MLSALQVVMLPYPARMNRSDGMKQAKPGKELFEKANLPGACAAKGGCPMTLLEILALLTFTVTVAYETIDVTLKFLQYIESKHNKKD